MAHCRWTSCVVRLIKLYHKLLLTQNNFRRSIVTRRHDCTVMFMIKCCRTEVNQSNVWRLHSPEIHLLNMHSKTTTSTVDKMPSPLSCVSFLSHTTLLHLLTTGRVWSTSTPCTRYPWNLKTNSCKLSFQNESIHAEKFDVKVNSEPRSAHKKIVKIHCYYKNNMQKYQDVKKMASENKEKCGQLYSMVPNFIYVAVLISLW